jgi:ethanolamine utilization protein EutN
VRQDALMWGAGRTCERGPFAVILGKVVGTVVSTQKDPNLVGLKLQLVQAVSVKDQQPEGRTLVAVDSVGAGVGDLVMLVTGSSARLTALTRQAPTDATIVAIVDIVEVDGTVVFGGGQL